MAGGWRKQHNEKFHNLYTSPNIIRLIRLWGMKWKRYVAKMGDMRNVYSILVRKHVGKRICKTSG
jgi:hypothetical protein